MFAAGDRKPAQEALVRALRELRALRRGSPCAANEALVEWLVSIPAALREVHDPERSLARQIQRALTELMPWLGLAAASEEIRGAWAGRLWPVLLADESEFLEGVGDAWGLLTGPKLAAEWASRLYPELHCAWSKGHDDRASRACLSALIAAERYRDVLELLALRTIGIWPERRFGVIALAALGRVDDSIDYARDSNLLGHAYQQAIAEQCEQVLLAAGDRHRAYVEFAHSANHRQNYLQTFRSLTRKYPEREPSTILSDLIEASPGLEGRWFATARSLRFFNLAAEIAQRAPCDPRTLNRAAGERLAHDPGFAYDVAVASLRWIAEGHGYLIDGADVFAAYDIAVDAARRLGRLALLREQIAVICEGMHASAEWIRRLITPQLDQDS